MASPISVFRKNATALITGGASGVGLAVAKLCASHAMNVIIVDNNKSQLSEAETALASSGGKGGKVETHAMDVSSLADWAALKTEVESKGTRLDLLHLNAGIGAKGEWTDSAYFHKIFDVSSCRSLGSNIRREAN